MSEKLHPIGDTLELIINTELSGSEEVSVDQISVDTIDIRDETAGERLRRRRREPSANSSAAQCSAEAASRRQSRQARTDQMDVEVFYAVDNDDCAKLLELIKEGANVNTVYRDYSRISTKSLLHICCEKGKLECAKIVTDNGALLNIRDKWGQSPLMYCMITHYHEIGEMLCSRQPDLVNDQDHYGKSPLHCAAESGCLESIRLLVKYGADVCCQNCFGVTPVMAVVTQTDNCPDPGGVLRLLLEAGYDLEMKDFRSRRTALQMAVLARNIPAVEVLLAAGADVNATDGAMRTPLTNAIYRFTKQSVGGKLCEVEPDGMMIIVMLTQCHADLNLTLESSNPLACCAKLNADDLAQYFLENGADPDVMFLMTSLPVPIDTTGATPLLAATGQNNIAVAKVLLRWNCSMSHKTRTHSFDGDHLVDAFQLSLHLGHLKIASLLVSAGYELQSVDYIKKFVGQQIPRALEENPEFFELLQDLANTPRPLTEACVLGIRKVLGRFAEEKLTKLQVPPRIRDMISFRHRFEWAEAVV